MAVRFLPPPSEESSSPSGDRSDLAEVIELRSLLSHATWRAPASSGEQQAAAGVPEEAHHASRDADPNERENVVHGNFSRAVGDPPAAAPPTDGATVSAREDTAPGIRAGSERSTHDDGVRLLARKARSSGELRQELLRLDHPPNEVESVVAEFEQRLYLDDAGLARVLTEKLRDAKRASRSQIRVKLRERKIADSAIEAALGELDDDDELALLRSTATERARSMRDLDRQTAERRLLGYLARRGWSGEAASRAVREALDDAGSRRSNATDRGGVRFR